MALLKARGIVAAARDGKDFDQLADEHGGNIFPEPFARGEQQDSVEDFAWRVKVGEISDPIRTPSGGYFILKLVKRDEERVRSFDEVKHQITAKIRQWKVRAARLKVQSQLLRDSIVTPRRYKRQLRQAFAQQTRKLLKELSL
jgi:parvulin-like peptidyl-prolyl isomerase